MKLPVSWLTDWVDLPADWDARELARRLTAAGLEIEGISAAAGAFSGVVVARIVSAEPFNSVPTSAKRNAFRSEFFRTVFSKFVPSIFASDKSMPVKSSPCKSAPDKLTSPT